MPQINRAHIDFQDLIFRHFFFKLDRKILFLNLTLDFLHGLLVYPVVEDIVFDNLLRDGGGTLREIEVLYCRERRTQNTADINAVVFVKTFVLHRDKGVGKVFGYPVHLLIASVGIGSYELCQLIALGVIDNRRKALRKDRRRVHVRHRAQNALERANAKAGTDNHDGQDGGQHDLQCSDKEQFFEFYGF